MTSRWYRWRHWRAAAKFWRKRALKAEAALEAERWRNLEREDTLVTVPMRLAGLWGMPPRDAPAPIKQVAPRALTAASDPWDNLTWADRQEFELEWRPFVNETTTEKQVKQRFLNEVIIPRRQSLNDEFASMN